MGNTKFKVKELVIYQNGEMFELGIIKKVINKNDNEEQDYFVNYHTGDTAARTPEHTLHKVKNAYAFLCLRRKANTESIDETHARQLANEIIDFLPQTKQTEGEAYFEIEDGLTEFINEYKV